MFRRICDRVGGRVLEIDATVSLRLTILTRFCAQQYLHRKWFNAASISSNCVSRKTYVQSYLPGRDSPSHTRFPVSFSGKPSGRVSWRLSPATRLAVRAWYLSKSGAYAMSGWPGGPATKAAGVERDVTVVDIRMLKLSVDAAWPSQPTVKDKHVVGFIP